MNSPGLSLQPYPSAGSLPDITIVCDIERQDDRLTIRYKLVGRMEELLIPPTAGQPARETNLWEETCFELFLGVRESQQYWEFNLSPAGHWNVFRFDAYREGMREEGAFLSLPFKVQDLPGALQLILETDMNRIIRAGQSLDAGISAVIKKRDGDMSYWSLTHPGPRPDFHHRDSFIIKL